jgi:hypothetical protein
MSIESTTNLEFIANTVFILFSIAFQITLLRFSNNITPWGTKPH